MAHKKYFYFVMGHFGWAWGGTMPRGFGLEKVGAKTTLVKKNLIFRPHAITWTVMVLKIWIILILFYTAFLFFLVPFLLRHYFGF
jgi:hypothetical protein